MTSREELIRETRAITDDLQAVTHILDTAGYYEAPEVIIAAGFHRRGPRADQEALARYEAWHEGYAARIDGKPATAGPAHPNAPIRARRTVREAEQG